MLAFRILGPLEVQRDGRPLRLGAAKQRALLACLLVRPGEVVSTDLLIDDLWGEETPPTAEHMLHVYVSRLRKVLEEDGRKVLVTQPPGYLLQLGADDRVDATEFETLVREARGSARERPAGALALLDRALGLWRGPVLADFSYESFAQAPAARMGELRAVAEEERIEALLALGRHDDAIPELETLVARFPLRERLRAQQMLALYRGDRQADALSAFQSARRTLAQELGVDPGPALTALESAILRHDPELAAPERAAEPAAPTPSVETRHPRRSWAVAAVVAAGVLVLGTIGVSVSGTRPEEQRSPSRSSAAPVAGSAIRLRWTEAPVVEDLGGAGDQVVLGGASTPFGYLAFGYTASMRTAGTTGRDFDAAVWMATVPGRWRKVDDPSFAASGNQRATDAAVLGDDLVVVGVDGSHRDFDPAVWISTDSGSTWSRVATSSLGLRQAGDQGMRDVTVLGRRVVAVGYARSGADNDAAVWWSTDGRDWTRLIEETLGGPGDEEMDSVVAYGRLLVAGGFAALGDDEDAAVWISRDGIHWRRRKDDALSGPGGQHINAIAVAGPRLVAVGQETVDGDTDAVVWTSTDGSDWQRVADTSGQFGGAGPQRMFAVASSPLGIVAAGSDGTGAGTNGAVWTSVDGTTWQVLSAASPLMSALAGYGRETVKVLIPMPDGFLALGAEGRGADNDADAWIGRPVS